MVRGLTLAWVAVVAAGPPPAAAADFLHVRSDDAEVRALLAAGYERSATFKALVDEIDARPGIVYVAQAVKLSGNLEGALLHTVAGSRELPMLRVLLKRTWADRTRLRSSATNSGTSSRYYGLGRRKTARRCPVFSRCSTGRMPRVPPISKPRRPGESRDRCSASFVTIAVRGSGNLAARVERRIHVLQGVIARANRERSAGLRFERLRARPSRASQDRR